MINNVLIIDSDIEICKQIKYSLLSTDTDVYYVHSASEALRMLQMKTYSLIIMDVLLSEAGGIEVLKKVRQMADSSLMVLLEQANSQERVMALKWGADDVLNKPYDLDECLVRAQILIRHFTERHPIVGRRYVVVGQEPLMLDTAQRMVCISGREIKLTRKEYDILLYMLMHRKQVLSFEQIYNAVWNEVFIADNSVIFYHVSKLRKKIGENWIENVYGVGYRMRDPISS